MTESIVSRKLRMARKTTTASNSARDSAVLRHETAAGGTEYASVAGGEELVDRGRGHPRACHRVVDALTGRRRHHAGGVADDDDARAVVPAAQRLHRDGSPFATDRFEAVEARSPAKFRRRRAQREALSGAADADARGRAVREYPAVEVGRHLALVPDVAAGRTEVGVGSGSRRADDLVIGRDVARPPRARNALAGHCRGGAIRTDDGACADRERAAVLTAVAHADGVRAVRESVPRSYP